MALIEADIQIVIYVPIDLIYVSTSKRFSGFRQDLLQSEDVMYRSIRRLSTALANETQSAQYDGCIPYM